MCWLLENFSGHFIIPYFIFFYLKKEKEYDSEQNSYNLISARSQKPDSSSN